MNVKKFDICIVGGAGHVGLPLGIMFASKNFKVLLYDTNEKALDTLKKGKMPFIEYGAENLLKKNLNKKLFFTFKKADIAKARQVIIAIGTPVDSYFNPKLRILLELFEQIKPYLHSRQTIIIRSTVYPNTCRQIMEELKVGSNPIKHLAYCPERIAQGYALRELQEFPQLVSGLSRKAVKDAKNLFSQIAPLVITVTVEEAELAKLFSNAWRYIQFAVANQFYMFADDLGVDFNRIRKVMVEGYGRASSLPTAGFAAGPCLLKDTLQLAAFNNKNFSIGHAAVMVNEGLPNYLVEKLRRKFSLRQMHVGILGMAFKADIDDKRDSLSYKLVQILKFYGSKIYMSDEYIKDSDFITASELIRKSDVIIIGVPHSAYKKLRIPRGKYIIDPWGMVSNYKNKYV